MGPPTGGRNHITPRFIRHFTVLSFADMTDDAMCGIFNTIYGDFLKRNQFSEEVVNMCEKTVQASVQIFKRALDDLRPTPSKSRYTFNLRDVARVVQGIMFGSSKKVIAKRDLASVWAHEIKRVFGDRLIDKTDHDWLTKESDSFYKETFGLEHAQVEDDSIRHIW